MVSHTGRARQSSQRPRATRCEWHADRLASTPSTGQTRARGAAARADGRPRDGTRLAPVDERRSGTYRTLRGGWQTRP